MRRADGGGAGGGATAAELGAGNGCMPGSRAHRCFVVGGLPRVAGRIGPSRVEPTPQLRLLAAGLGRCFGEATTAPLTLPLAKIMLKHNYSSKFYF